MSGRDSVKRRIRDRAQGLGALNPALERLGLRIVPTRQPEQDPTLDFPQEWKETIGATAGYTMVSHERQGALIQAVEHVVANEVSGAIVECGVWKGGSSMAAALTLKRLDDGRDVYLFDTFEGMSAPTEEDMADAKVRNSPGELAGTLRVEREDVVEAMRSTGYPLDRVHVVKGMVEDTIPDQAPEQIALLRLDTDFYRSTRHELQHLFPRLARNGILIIDDYGELEGARKAVDEFFEGDGVFLHRVDYTGRLVVRR